MLGFSRKAGQASPITLGDLARGIGQWELAAEHYRTALIRNPENPPIWVQYGHALKESGKHAQAEAAYRRAIEGAPAVADSYLQLGHVLKRQGRAEEATAAYLRALALDPDLADARRELNGLEWAGNQLTEVLRELASQNGRPGRKRRRPSVITQADRARDLGQWDIAAKLYRKALERNPRNAAIWLQYGHVLKESGDLEPAASAYRRAIADDPSGAEPYAQLGHVLRIQGKTEEAQACYLRAFARDPMLGDPLSELSGLGWSEKEVAALKALAEPI
jgi:tetratricopeptide (TPR) repeat protein